MGARQDGTVVGINWVPSHGLHPLWLCFVHVFTQCRATKAQHSQHVACLLAATFHPEFSEINSGAPVDDNFFGDAPGHARLYNQLGAFGQHGRGRKRSRERTGSRCTERVQGSFTFKAHSLAFKEKRKGIGVTGAEFP